VSNTEQRCRWCASGPPEWSPHTRVWIHRLDPIDRKCEDQAGNDGIRQALIDADSALSLIYHRNGRAVEEMFGREFKKDLTLIYNRCRLAVQAIDHGRTKS
jgi:hypothetical protein